MEHFAPKEFTPEEEALYIYNNATDWKDARKMLMAWHLQDCTKEYKQKIHSIVGWLCEKHGYFTVHLNHETLTEKAHETILYTSRTSTTHDSRPSDRGPQLISLGQSVGHSRQTR